jgi:hypothetical protein
MRSLDYAKIVRMKYLVKENNMDMDNLVFKTNNYDENWKHGYHIDSSSKIHKVKDMDTQYLLNVIACYKHKYNTDPLTKEVFIRGL